MQIEISSLLHRKKAGKGSFDASVDKQPFLKSDTVLFQQGVTDFFIIGMADNNENLVGFSVPVSLEGSGPHVVKYYTGTLEWQVTIEGVVHAVEAGSVTVTFKNDRNSVEGAVDFLLPGGRKVSGAFDIAKG
ncbi:hypothetical protein ACOYXF_07650 [Pseudomonas sp. Tul1A2]